MGDQFTTFRAPGEGNAGDGVQKERGGTLLKGAPPFLSCCQRSSRRNSGQRWI